MNFFSENKLIFVVIAAVGLTACQNQSTVSVNGNQTNISNVPLVGNVNVVTNTNSANGNVTTGENVGIEAREPDQYQATVTLKLETGNQEKTTAFPPLTAQVFRAGNNRRMEFALPGGEKLIYLDLGGRQIVISPSRKQYAELNKEALGVEPRRLLMPEQIVKQVKNIRGVERVGEDRYGERDVIKYRYVANAQVTQPAANTQNQSNTQNPANVSTDAVVLVDKETGLPLRSETFAETNSNATGGLKNLRLVTEMSNLQMTTDPNVFTEPTDFRKVPAEEIRGQIELIFRALGAFLQQTMNVNSQAPANQPPAVNTNTANR
jgi:hypothetical protein